jgi:hypothetical protein
MPTPPVKSAPTISHFTAGTRQPYSIEFVQIVRISASGRPPLSGVKPTSCMSRNATTNIRARINPRAMKGAPRLIASATNPPATEPISIPAPVTIWPRPNTDSRSPSKPVALSASTSHASTAPEKKVNPSPSRSEATAQAQNAASICHR